MNLFLIRAHITITLSSMKSIRFTFLDSIQLKTTNNSSGWIKIFNFILSNWSNVKIHEGQIKICIFKSKPRFGLDYTHLDI